MPYANQYLEALESRGEARGEAKALTETIMKVVRQRFPQDIDVAREWAGRATMNQLKAVVDRFFVATTLVELLGEDEN